MGKTIKELKAEMDAKKASTDNVKMPKTEAPKEKIVHGKSFSAKGADKKDREILSIVGMAKQLRAAEGKGLTDRDKDAVARLVGAKAVSLTTDAALDDTFASGPASGLVEKDIWEDTNISKIINYREINEIGQHQVIDDSKLKVYLIGEGDSGTQSNSAYAAKYYDVKKFMGRTGASYETLADSIIDVAAEKLADLRMQMGVYLERAIINGDNTASPGHMDAVDLDGDAYTATSPERGWKGLRKITLGKGSIDFGGTTLSDDSFLEKILNMQEEGGKYLDENQIGLGNTFLMLTQNVYNRIKLMNFFTDASKSGLTSSAVAAGAVGTVAGIPVTISSYMPSLTLADGTVGDGTSGSVNQFGSMVLFNKNFFEAYAKSGSMTNESKREPSNQTMEWFTSARYGFNGRYDRPDSTGTIDTARKYAVAGVNINLAKA